MFNQTGPRSGVLVPDGRGECRAHARIAVRTSRCTRRYTSAARGAGGGDRAIGRAEPRRWFPCAGLAPVGRRRRADRCCFDGPFAQGPLWRMLDGAGSRV